MTVDLSKNGEWSLLIRAGDDIDLAILDQMALRAKNGTTVQMVKVDGGVSIKVVESKL